MISANARLPLLVALIAPAAGCAGAQAPEVPRRDAPADTGQLGEIVRYLAAEVDSGAFPGAVLAVVRGWGPPVFAAVGHYGIDDPRPVDTTTVYDLASLTKVVGLTTGVMLLAQEGQLDLSAPVQRYVRAFRGPLRERVTVRHLLTHSSGLPAWRPLYVEATTRGGAMMLADTTALSNEPGRVTVYSDIGAIVLTQVVETVTGERLDRFLARRVFEPLGMRDTRFVPPSEWRNRVAPTERSQDGTVIRGTVHDENAWRLGGVSGHAGLFSTAGDLALFARCLLDAWHGRPNALALPSDLVRTFVRRQNIVPGSSRALGWDTPSNGSSAGARLSPAAFGHTGFTGTSIWIDPTLDLAIILLTNRVHPSRENARIFRVRPRVADLAVEALGRPAR
jgi:CubicO group peptidase (beta-lactamase class C family)